MICLNKNLSLFKKQVITLIYLKHTINITSRNIASKKIIDLSYNSYENLNSDNNAPPLIVMHGLFGSKQNWRSLCKAINQKTNPSRKVIAIDARNHGESPHSHDHRYEDMVEDIVQLMNKLNITKASVLGHSMGGRAMMLLALKYPELIEKGIFVDISPVSTSPQLEGMITIFDSMKNVKVDKNIPMVEARQLADNQLKTFIQDRSIRDFLLTNFILKLDGSYGWRVNVDALHRNFSSHIAKFPVEAAQLKYTGPVLFIGGANSDYIREAHLPEIRDRYFPAASLIHIPNAGHWIHSEQPAAFLELTLKFLNK